MRLFTITRAAGVVPVLMIAGLAAQLGAADETTALPATACASLQGMTIPAAAIGLETSGAEVQTAAMVAASASGNPNGEYCKVTGIVKPKNPSSPSLEFEVNLPASWNRRALQMGGGGYNGTLVTGLTGFTLQPATVDNPLEQGYVTLGSDGGHKSTAGFDGRFAMDDEALANFGKHSVKKAHDAAMAVITKAYGRAPERFYFIGGSQGGHEALDAAARYHRDYDGVVAHYPAYNVTLLHLGSLNAGRAVYEGGGAAWLNPAKTKLITDAVYAKCDPLDGVTDGIISHVKACNAAFDVKTLRCANGADSGRRVPLGRTARRGGEDHLRLQAGVRRRRHGHVPALGAARRGALPRAVELGSGAAAVQPALGQGAAALHRRRSDRQVHHHPQSQPRHDVVRSEAVQGAGGLVGVDDGRHRREPRAVQGQGRQDPHDPRHRRRLHHAAQQRGLLPRQVKQFGQAGVDSFLRFYMIPGFGHGFGPFNAKIDSLTVLRDWVEKGEAPKNLTAVDGNANASRSRPLCEWPKWPKFTGAAGTENSAASFTCVAP